MKRVVSTLLALMLVLALVGTAAAEATEPVKGSITINNAVKEKTYTIYRIFDLDSHNTDYSAINYKVSAKWADFFKTGAEGLNYVTIDDMGYVTWKDSASAADFAAKAFAFAKANNIANDGQQTADSSTVKFADLDLGYYLVQSDLGALCSLDTTMPNADIQEKNSKPTAEKEVEEDSTPDNYGDHNDADIGQKVNFRTTITVVDGDPKNYVLHDTMSAGLTFNGTVEVKIGNRTLTAGTDYTLVSSDLDDGCTFEVHFVDGKLKPNDVVTVTYSATVNANAVVGGTGNPNETHLSYGNDSSTSTSTTPSETRTYVWEFDVKKYTKKDDKEIYLAGAEFVLYKKTVDGKIYYVKAVNGKVTGWTETESEATVFVSSADDTFSISGLDADTYYLKEIKAPDGYNMLKDPVKVVITATIDQTTKVGTATVTYGNGATGTVEIENNTGTELPSTGGVGTTIFYVIGGLLMAVAVVLLVTKKKMSATK